MGITFKKGLLYAILVISFCLYLSYPKLLVLFLDLPDEINRRLAATYSLLVFIYDNPCLQCNSGEFLSSLSKRKDINERYFIITPSFSQIDIDNLIRTFNMSGEIVLSEPTLDNFIKKVIKLFKKERNSVGFALDVVNKKIKNITFF